MNTRLRASIISGLGIRAGEGSVVALLLLHSLFVGIVLVFTATAADALFLVSYGAENLPVVYVLSSVVTVFAGWGYSKLGDRLPLTTLLIVNLSVLLVGAVVIRVLLATPGARWPSLVLQLWSVVLSVLLNLEFWTLAGRLFNVRQGKRLFGLVGSGEAVAAIMGGLMVPVLVPLIGTANLLVVAAGGVGGAILCLLAIIRRFGATMTPEEDQTKEAPVQGVRALARNHYVVLMFIFSSLCWLAFYVIDNAFLMLTTVRFPDPDQLAGFLGVFNAVTGACLLVVRLVVSGQIIGRYGVLVGLVLLPILDGAGMTTVLLTGGLAGVGVLMFWLLTTTKMIDTVLGGSIYQSAFQMLYQPLPPMLRLRVQTLSESLVDPIAGIVAGLGLLALVQWLHFDVVALAATGLIILVVLTVVGVRLGRAYPGMLLESLTKRRLDGSALTLTDQSSFEMLRKATQSPHDQVVVYALELLQQSGHDALGPIVTDLLDHPSAVVRTDALQRIEQLNLVAALGAVRRRLSVEDDAAARAAAVRTVVALGQTEAFEEIAAYLDDPDPAVQVGAMVGLLRHGGIEGVLRAGEKLIDLARSSAPSERAFAARALGEVGIISFYRPLAPLLLDPHPETRRAALVAAGKLKTPQLWPLVLDGLAVPTVREAAMAALVAGGEAALPALGMLLTRANQPPDVLSRAARICGRVRGNTAIQVLTAHLGAPNARVRREVLAALVRCGYAPQGIERRHVRDQIAAEGREVARFVAAATDVGADQATALLHAALEYQVHQGRERLFSLLSLLYDARTIGRARDNLLHTSRDKRAYALEVIDTVVEQDLKPIVFAICDEVTPDERRNRFDALWTQPRLPPPERLGALVTGEAMHQYPWISACALYALASVAPSLHRELALQALIGTDPLMAETAAWTLRTYEEALTSAVTTHVSIATSYEPLTGANAMLSTIEKVLILKTVDIFSGTPDEVLVDVASILEEVEYPAGTRIVEKGDAGTCMYLVVDGRVRVHDEGLTLNELGERDVFGEMAVLDAAPRTASVTALDDTRLFRLDQDALYELMSDRIEVVRGIIRILSARLRDRMRDVSGLHARLDELHHARDAPRIQ